MQQNEGRVPTSSRAKTSTRELILDSAEHEFANHGYKGASLRRLTERAGVALGNVGHIFGGKHQLFGATYHRLFDPLYEERIEALDALLARSPAPSVAEIFDASAEPVARFLTHEKGALRGMFAIRGLTEHDAFWPFVKQSSERLGNRYLVAIERALHDVPKEEVAFRWITATSFFLVHMTPTVQNVDDPTERAAAEIIRLRRYAIAILTDPLHGEPELSELPWSTP